MKIAHVLSILCFALITAAVFCTAADVHLGLNIHPAAIAAPIALYGFAGLYGFVPMPKNSLMLNFGAVANMSFPEIDGREAMGGYTSIAYLGFIADIDTFPTEPNIETITDVGNAAKLSGAFVMKASKHFYEVKVPPNTSKFSPASQGELGGKSFKNTGEIFIPGIDDQSMGLARMLNNRYAVLIFTDPDGKNRVVLGSKELPVTFMPKGDSGAKGVDKKGFTYTFECDSFAPGWIYEGPIPLNATTVVGVS